jgi:hypothetical protein
VSLRALSVRGLRLTWFGALALAGLVTPTVASAAQHPALANGDIVLRYTNAVWSRVFARLNGRDMRFSHAGVVVAEGGHWRVIHAEADDFGRNGQVRLDDWAEFFATSERVAILRLDDPDAAAATAAAAVAMHRAALPFDLSFDLGRDSAVYCTELVWRALRVALGHDPLPSKARIQGREAVLVENLLLDISELALIHLAE